MTDARPRPWCGCTGQLAPERDEIIKEYNDPCGKILAYERLLSDEANVRAVIRED
jgi:hypothetical protein